MIPAEETKNDGSPSCARALGSGRPRNHRRASCRAAYPLIAAVLLASPPVVQAQEKPLEIGVLALGPRIIPVWQCGSEPHQPASAQPRHETVPFYVRGLLDELEKL